MQNFGAHSTPSHSKKTDSLGFSTKGIPWSKGFVHGRNYDFFVEEGVWWAAQLPK